MMLKSPPALAAAIRALHRSVAGVAILLMPGSCGPTYHAPPVTPELARLSPSPVSQLQSGYLVHQTNCAKCHAFEDPARHEIGKLTRKIIPAMAGKAKLGAAEQQAVLAYLLAARQVPPHPAP